MTTYFKHLNYTLGDEDAQAEMDMLQPHAQHVLAIADCGSRIVPLLAKAPARVTCVDISPEQLAVARLRLALLRTVDATVYSDFLGYTGNMAPSERQALFRRLPLEARDAAVLEQMMERIQWGCLVYEGKFERMLIMLSKVTRAVLGSACDRLFEHDSVAAQAAYFRDEFPHFRWKAVLGLLGNSNALNSLLYKGDFPEKNIPKSYFRIYADIFDRLITGMPARESFFLQLIFLGRIRYREGLPIECRADVYEQAQRHIRDCDVRFVEGDVLQSFGATGGGIDFLSLSDVPSFLPDDLAARCLQLAHSHMRRGGLAVIRGHVRLVKPDLTGYVDVSDRYKGIVDRETTGLWHIHSYQVAPDRVDRA
ncbi:DUF3419 family protein [Corallococcus exercitus]|uniref:DUF3419 family protein n=1 Tax=Corallococcus exercitus TaxID=2316736 RepID=A0A3A8IQ68_9BACT|nr:DUF3419 family protein [Corallococcus exercitus]NOK36003.1 DUF3419 family protein [Corallococcus exercitus]RKG79523.1 DUF3419 family protein [Corallococcus exercitus]